MSDTGTSGFDPDATQVWRSFGSETVGPVPEAPEPPTAEPPTAEPPTAEPPTAPPPPALDADSLWGKPASAWVAPETPEAPAALPAPPAPELPPLPPTAPPPSAWGSPVSTASPAALAWGAAATPAVPPPPAAAPAVPPPPAAPSAWAGPSLTWGSLAPAPELEPTWVPTPTGAHPPDDPAPAPAAAAPGVTSMPSSWNSSPAPAPSWGKGPGEAVPAWATPGATPWQVASPAPAAVPMPTPGGGGLLSGPFPAALLAVSAVLLVVGSLGPWANATLASPSFPPGSSSFSGFGDTNPGRISLALGVVALLVGLALLLVRKVPTLVWIVGAVAGLAALGCTGYELADTTHALASADRAPFKALETMHQATLGAGWGLYLALAGAVLVLAGSALCLRRPAA